MNKIASKLISAGAFFFLLNESAFAAGQGGISGNRVIEGTELKLDALKNLEKISVDLNIPIEKLFITEKANTLSYSKFDKPFNYGIDWENKTITFKDGETISFGELSGLQ